MKNLNELIEKTLGHCEKEFNCENPKMRAILFDDTTIPVFVVEILEPANGRREVVELIVRKNKVELIGAAGIDDLTEIIKDRIDEFDS